MQIPFTNIKVFERVNTGGSELSSYKSPYYDKSYLEPYNPDDLVTKKGGLDIYEKMGYDDQVKAVLTMKKQAILSSGYKIEPAGEEKQYKEQADFITWNFEEGIKGNFTDGLYEILSALDYGFSVTEKLYCNIPKGDYAGKIGLYQLKTRPPQSFMFPLDEKGNLKYIRQNTDHGSVNLPPQKFILYSYNSTYGNPYGNSDLRAAYRSWWSKNIIIKFWNIYLERFGMPTAVGKFPKNATDTQIENLKKILKNIQSKTAITLDEAMNVSLLEAQRRGDAGYQDAVKQHNIMIARAMLIPDLLGFSETTGGSYNLGENQFNLFMIILNRLRGQIEETIVNEQIIKQLIDLNYPNVDKYPYFEINPLAEKDVKELATIFINAVEKGVVLPNAKDEEYLRESLNFPVIPQNEIESARVEKKEKEDAEKAVKEEEKKRREEESQMPIVPIPPETQMKQFKLSRQPNQYEKEIDFTAINNEIDNFENKTIDDAVMTVRKIQDNLINKISKGKIIENKDISAINKLTLNNLGDLRMIFKEALRNTYSTGKNRGKTNIIAKTKQTNMATKIPTGLPPVKAIQYFNEKSIEITGIVRDDLLNKSKTVLMKTLKDGGTMRDAMMGLEEIFTPYLDTTIIPEGVTEAYRLETIVRTNLSDAYNMGMEMEYETSEFVEAYEWSSILDTRTSDYCIAMDKKIFTKNNANFNFPPAHFNCRSLVVPVVEGEKYTLSKKNPVEPKSGVKRGKGF